MLTQCVVVQSVPIESPGFPTQQAIEMAVAGERNARQGDLSAVLSALLTNVRMTDWPRFIANAITYALSVHEHPDPEGFHQALASEIAAAPESA